MGGKAFALHVINPSVIPYITYDSFPEHCQWSLTTFWYGFKPNTITTMAAAATATTTTTTTNTTINNNVLF